MVLVRFYIFCIILVGVAYSQVYISVPDTAFFALDTVTVTATRHEKKLQKVPYAISVLQLGDRGSVKKGVSLEEVLRSIPGIQINNRHNFSQGDRIAIRGLGSRASFGVRGIKVLLDDIPLTMPDGQTQLNNIDIGSIGYAEIMRGPSSSLYGNASGGVIIFRSDLEKYSNLHISQKTSLGSYGFRKTSSRVSGNWKNSMYFLNYTDLNSDGFRHHSNAKIRQLNFIVKREFNSKLTSSIVLNYFDAPFMLNPSSLSKSDAIEKPQMARSYVKNQGAGKKVNQGQGGISIDYRPTEFSNIRATLYGVNRSLFNAIPGRIINLDRTVGGIRSTFSQTFYPLGKQTVLLVGSDLEFQKDVRRENKNLGLLEDYASLEPDEILNNVDAGELILDQKESVSTRSLFSQIEFNLIEKWSIFSGFRVDNYKFNVDDYQFTKDLNNSGKRIMQNLSPMFGISFRKTPQTSFYAHYATAFQTPTTSELSNRPDGAGGFNPSLEPELIKNYELGAKGVNTGSRIQYSFSIYNMDISNMLIPYQIPQESEEIFFRNAGHANNKGIELSTIWYLKNSLNLSFAYTYSRFRFIDYQVEYHQDSQTILRQLRGNNLPGVPDHHFNCSINLNNLDGLSAIVDFNYTDKFFANDLNGHADTANLNNFINDSYFLVDAQLSYRLKIRDFVLEPYFVVDNIFNNRHNRSIVPNAFGNRFFEPAAGRSFAAGVGFDLSLL